MRFHAADFKLHSKMVNSRYRVKQIEQLKANQHERRISKIMIGPDPNGLGGISRVVSLWQEGRILDSQEIEYISTVSDISGRKFLDFGKALLNFIRRCDRNIRTIYIHTASNNSFYRKSIFLIVSCILRKRIILHIHPTYFVQFLSGMKGIRKKAIFSLLRQVDTFVVLTEEMQEKLRSLFPGIPVEVLRNPVNIEAMKNPNGIQREKNRILYLGWYNREKGVYDLIDAVKIFLGEGHSISLRLFGTKEIEQLRKYVKNAGVDEVVEVHGWANNEKKIEELHKATFLILPSYTEGIPNVIIEAMAAKTPIISTLAGGLKEVLRDGENAIIIEPGNIRDISNKIVYGLKNEELRKAIAENAYRDATKKYDIAHIKRNFESLIGL